ncbi:uncharacterized protein FOMMEDRAFT_25125 [Fomitiporia mediterranea MF3/22]|uniref:uncharacterized protein n=1 Tax=Fomitiporia mediterranea (strain MF3/22) TaxID=694068 RepID=UPI00044099CB|nr:uncharacterized protein FOMMEDRAFT_25125 [Fomitiporia mediterranea MF3/22]EJD07871.1 hypothetical protein FOMMEDRAFT_25125 [Fomitiporia mediterranea MF3/22]
MPRMNDGHNSSSNVSLPSVGSSTVQVQHIQSPSEMFSALGVIAFFQATLSVALFSLFNDVFSDYRNNDTSANASFEEVVSRVFALSLGSVLLSAYTGVASSILVAIDCSRAGAPEVVLPLVFGGVTEIAATQTFLFW